MLPNLAQFDVKSQVVHGQPISVGYLVMTTGYAALDYSHCLLFRLGSTRLGDDRIAGLCG